MAKDWKRKLNERQAPQEPVAPLNDYLYVDRARILAYHTQLLGMGVPLQSRFTETYKQSEKNLQEFGVPKLVSAKFSGEDTGTYGSERTFDQSWPVLLQTIEELFAHGYIHEGALGVPVGSLVRLHGMISFIDLRILRDLWNPLVKMFKQTSGPTKGAKAPNMGHIAEIAKFIPHPLIVQLVTSAKATGQPFEAGAESLNAWGILEQSNLIGTADSFAIMNGGVMPGEYWMIAVLDVGSTTEAPQFDFSNVNVTNTFEFAFSMQQFIRMAFGRPHYANGVTPLMIYRRLTRTDAHKPPPSTS